MVKTNQTNYVLVIDFDPSNNYLEDQYLIGWDNDTDWYTEVDGSDLLTPTGRLKKRSGCCIDVDRWISCYVDPDLNWMRKTCEDSKREGYDDCIVCRLEKNTDKELIVVPV
jgi:hypothetical protein